MIFKEKETDLPLDMNELRISETNLLSLLSKLYTPGSACTLEDPSGSIRVIAEKDIEHYGERLRGVMHPITEIRIKELQEFLSSWQ